MATNPRWSVTARKAGLNAMLDLANGGTLVYYTLTQPTNADTTLGSQSVLVTFQLASPAFSAAAGASGSNTTKTANAVGIPNASAGGTVGWFCVYESDGTTVVFQGSVGTVSGFDLIVDTTTITNGDPQSLTSAVWTFAP